MGEYIYLANWKCLNLIVFLSTQDALPITCQFGRGYNTSYLCATIDEDGLVQIFDTRHKALLNGQPRIGSEHKLWF